MNPALRGIYCVQNSYRKEWQRYNLGKKKAAVFCRFLFWHIFSCINLQTTPGFNELYKCFVYCAFGYIPSNSFTHCADFSKSKTKTQSPGKPGLCARQPAKRKIELKQSYQLTV
ncbi:MAG: hypothetical protein LUH82_02570 [Clostridiales bacterium]|nr:hypothetical protein [Clostridiales bacterium]